MGIEKMNKWLNFKNMPYYLTNDTQSRLAGNPPRGQASGERKRIYVTHASGNRDDALMNTDTRVTPDKLYTAATLQRFVKRCRLVGVDWAIFSPVHGVLFPSDEIAWYYKDLRLVTNDDYQSLCEDFLTKLGDYDEIWFYHNPGLFDVLYQSLIFDLRYLGMNIIPCTHLEQIQ